MPFTWLPLLLGLGALGALASRSLAMRRAGVNPWVLPAGDDAHGFLGRAMLALAALHLFVLLTWALAQGWALRALGAVPLLLNPFAAWGGILLMIAGLALVVLAQREMGMSWRVGIPSEGEPRLVATGPFRYSRNPVFLGMLLASGGVAAAVPHALSFAAFAGAVVALSAQVRLEEAYLEARLGEDYAAYAGAVGRWFGRVRKG
jgi:protein-S-isoprenylcysteine O-methyltransferase Ste14